MARRGNHLAPYIRAYMAETGLKIRAAQIHAQKGHPDWLAFMDRSGGGNLALVKAGKGSPKLPAAETPDSGTRRQAAEEVLAELVTAGHGAGEWQTLEEEMEWRAERIWRLSTEAAERAFQENDFTGAAVFTKQAGEAAAAYRKAKDARVRADLEARRLISAGEFEQFRELVQRLADMVIRLDLELPAHANPEQPEVAATAIRDWLLHRWNPFVLEVIDQAA